MYDVAPKLCWISSLTTVLNFGMQITIFKERLIVHVFTDQYTYYVPLHHLCSVSLSKQCIPNEWKYHSITPIYKSGDKSNVMNYRPISLLCIVSKVLEHLVYNKVSTFIINNNILCHQQFGFCQHHSTIQQLLIFLSNVQCCRYEFCYHCPKEH